MGRWRPTTPAGGWLCKHRCANPRSGGNPKGRGHSPASVVKPLTSQLPCPYSISPPLYVTWRRAAERGQTPAREAAVLPVGTHNQPLPARKHSPSPSSASKQPLVAPEFSPSLVFSSPRPRQLLGTALDARGQSPLHPPPTKPHLHNTSISRLLPKLQIAPANTSHHAGGGQTRLDGPDLGREEHEALLPWGGWQAPRRAQPSRHTGSPDPPTSKPQRKELPGQFAAWAAGVTDRPEEMGRGKVEFTLRANSRSPSANTLALAPGPCSRPSTAIALGSRNKSWKRLAAVHTGNLSSGSKMEGGRNRLCNPSSPSLSSPEAQRAPQRAGVSNHLPHRGFLSAWEKPQQLSRVPARGFITSSGARADKVRRHAKNQEQISVQRGWSSSTQRHHHAPSLWPDGGLSAPKVDAGTQPDIPAAPSTHCLHATLQGWDAARGGQPPRPCPPQLLWLCPPRPCPLQPPMEAGLTFAENLPLFGPNN